MNSLESKVVTATKWSALTEIASKLISPIAGMILARLLTPEAYGAVATTTIIISFAELFTDAGFQKYIIQHDFTDDDDRNKSINVAFWTNLVMSLIIWGIIIAFRHPIANLVGSPGLETAIVVACAAIPIAAFSSIQSAIYKRNLNFRIPFIVRMIGLCVTFFITIPLAFWLRSYWALIISSLLQNSISAIILTIYSDWRPFLFYEINRFKLMLSFCSWVIIDSVLTWINHFLDLFIVSAKFDTHSLGIYKTSISTSNSILTTISAAIIPILLPTYSKMQNDIPQLCDMILKMQKYLGIIILPIGIITFLYSDIITKIFLGNQWIEAAPLIGVWGIVETFTLLVNRFCSHSYIALGKPHISVITSALYAVILLPTILITCQFGYQTLFISRTMVKLWLLCLHLIATYLLIKLSPSKVFYNIMPELLGCIIMIVISYLLSYISDSFIWQVSSMMICLMAYSLFIFSMKKERSIVIKLWQIATDKYFKRG